MLDKTTNFLVYRKANDIEAVDLLDKALQRPRGKPVNHNNIMNKSVQGTSENYALRKLRKDRPDLHAKVLASPYT